MVLVSSFTLCRRRDRLSSELINVQIKQSISPASKNRRIGKLQAFAIPSFVQRSIWRIDVGIGAFELCIGFLFRNVSSIECASIAY
jgi:hypothetical protein